MLPKLTEITVTLIGIALAACAIIFDGRWLDAHFLPSFFVSRSVYVLVAWLIRVATAAIGVALVLFLRRRIGNFVVRPQRLRPLTSEARAAPAVVFAFGATGATLLR